MKVTLILQGLAGDPEDKKPAAAMQPWTQASVSLIVVNIRFQRAICHRQSRITATSDRMD
jgi:hypothetical protein